MGNIYNCKSLVLVFSFGFKLCSSLILVLFSFSFAFGQEAPVKRAETVVACAEAMGLTHNLAKVENGYRLIVEFGIYSIKPKYNTETEMFDGPAYIGVDVPIENDNIRHTSMNWIKRKADFFKELFPDVKIPIKNKIQTSTLILDFAEKNCYIRAREEFIYANCRAEGPIVVNGVVLESIDFSIQNQMRTTLLSDPEKPNELVVGELEAYYANLVFSKKEGYGKMNYRSSTTYYPDGNDIQCHRR